MRFFKFSHFLSSQTCIKPESLLSFHSKHIVSNLTSQGLRNHFPSPLALLSHQQDHVIQARHLSRDFLEHQGCLGYQENHRSPEKTIARIDKDLFSRIIEKLNETYLKSKFDWNSMSHSKERRNNVR